MKASITNHELVLQGFKNIEEGRRQRAEGSIQKGIQIPPERELPNFQFGRGLKPLAPFSRLEGDASASLTLRYRAFRRRDFPFCLLPSAFFDKHKTPPFCKWSFSLTNTKSNLK